MRFSFISATLVTSLAGMEGDESFDASLLGSAEEVVQERLSDDELILIKGLVVIIVDNFFASVLFIFLFLRRTKARTASSIILRGANDYMLDEMERSVHDALCVVKRVLESKQVVAGGGAVEAALSIYLENLATSVVRIRVNLVLVE